MDMDQRSESPTVPPEPLGDDLRTMLRPGGPHRRSLSTMVLAAIALVAAGFVGGLLVGKSTEPSGQAALPGLGQNGPVFGNGRSGGPGAGDFTVGTITRIDGTTITLRTVDGNTVTVKVGDDTKIRVTKDGSLGDLAEGTTVVVGGHRDGDTVDADSISQSDGAGGPVAAPSGSP
jgi:hypothetical protein